MPLRIDILTTFPEMFAADAPAALGVSIPARARRAGVVEWHAADIRAHASPPHHKTDDRPFGGGPGMVMMCQPLWDAVHAVEAADPRPARRILLTPQGRPLTQALVEELAREERLLLIAGHYEGIDERVIQALAPLEVSLGDYVLSSGELAAMVLMDAIIRLLPGALGDEESAHCESFSLPLPDGSEGGRMGSCHRPSLGTVGGLSAPPDSTSAAPTPRLLDCPQYTRPREWMGRPVPEVLLGGDHGKVAAWRLEQRVSRTRARRPDLLA